MHMKIEGAKDDFLINNEIYHGEHPHISTKDIPPEDVKLYADIKIAESISKIKDDVNYNLLLQNKSLNTIKKILWFWVILTVVGIGCAVYIGIKLSYLFQY